MHLWEGRACNIYKVTWMLTLIHHLLYATYSLCVTCNTGKEMATPVFLPGKTEDPGGLKSVGSQRVAHDSVTKQHQQYVVT